MSLLIKNGEIITAEKRYQADILTENGTIKEIGQNLTSSTAEIIDATGKFIFPGFIDPHVHIHLPFMGTAARDDWATASKAAILGGTTTLIEMCCPARNEDPVEAIKLWKSKAHCQSHCDYTFHMGVTKFDETTADSLKKVVSEEHITSLKIFLAYKGAFGIQDEELYKTLTFAAENNLIVAAHCENAELVAQNQQKLVSQGKIGPEYHEPSRPISVEAEGCHHLMTFAQATGAEVYVVHTSCIPAVEAIEAAQKRGVKAHIEVVAPHLTLTSAHAELPDFQGAKYVMSPPLRTQENIDYLWEKLAQGSINTVGTDHAPFDFADQKQMGHPENALDANGQPTGKPGNFTLIPNGIPSIEERVKLLYNDGVLAGKIDLQTLVRTASTNAAKIFNLYPKKGAIEVGSDADLVIWDPEWRGEISVKTHHMATDYSAFEGKQIQGRPEVVTIRGKILVRDGQWVGKEGKGKFLIRENRN